MKDDPASEQGGCVSAAPRFTVFWSDRYGARGHLIQCPFIDDSDFTHDATLAVCGDFADREEAMRFAQTLCDMLNAAHAKPDPSREA